jgi:hypothetical protein
MTEKQFAELAILWETTAPADDDDAPDWDMLAAFEGCMDHCGFDISVLTREEQDELADAARTPEGPGPWANLRAANKLREMAKRDGWIVYAENALNDPTLNN